EMVHAYSLIHDDLPCMDDDALRRGKPTNHRVYGEGIALLAGDALLTQAVETMVCSVPAGLETRYWQALQELVKACNTQGMIGGQVLDLNAEGQQLNLDELQAIHRWKTGALIRAALRIGGIIGGGEGEVLMSLSTYGEAFGLAFQITDDLLDQEAETAVLGKTTGSDLRKQKATYPAIVGVEEARRLAAVEIEKAQRALQSFGEKGRLLRQLAEYVLHRNH
ncbi:MAG: polyprenyl synthetase family protein, partial [Firmicutes bacterium]|nr:polyprenyl synthetase family protein [Bacillota bacterium]